MERLAIAAHRERKKRNDHEEAYARSVLVDWDVGFDLGDRHGRCPSTIRQKEVPFEVQHLLYFILSARMRDACL